MTQETNTPPVISQELSDQIKQVWFESFYSHFSAMMNVIRKLPIQPNLLNIIVKEFDNGLLWTKEAFNCLSIPQPPTSTTPDIKVIGVQDAGKGNDAPVDSAQAA